MRHLYNFKGFYYFRLRVPLDLQGFFQCRLLKKALRTSDFKTATSSVKLLSSEYFRVIKLMRSGILTNDQMRGLARKFMDRTMHSFEWLTRRARLYSSIEQRDGRIEHYNFFINDLKDSLAIGKTEGIEKYVDGLLAEESITLEKNSDDYNRLCREITKTLIQVYKIEIERIRGNYDNWYDDFPSSLKPEKIETIRPNEKKKGKLLSAVIKEFIEEKNIKGDWTKKFEDEQRRLYKQFVEIMTDKDISEYDRDDIKEYVKILKKLPKNLNKVKGLRDIPMEKILILIKNDELNNYPLLDTTTINKKLTSINSIFLYAQEHRYITFNPAAKLSLKDDTRADEERDPYDLEDLKKWFYESPVYSKYSPEKLLKYPQHFWIPLIMLFTGCRTNEICQLYKKDIVEVDGTWCFSINQEEDKRTKTKGSRRTVPIHPTLIDIGFLDFVNSVNHERVWSDLKKGRDNYSHRFNRWIDDYNRKYITKDKKKVPYSFRHTLSTVLKHAGEPVELVDEITGHIVTGQSYGRYGKKFPPKKQLEALKKLDYGIDLSHLKFPLKKG